MTQKPTVPKASAEKPKITGDRPWVLPTHEPFQIINAKLIDPLEGRVIDNTSVLAVDGRFQKVSIGSTPNVGENVKVIDLGGKYLCPGLLDAHVHLTATPGESDLRGTYKNIPASMNNFRSTFLAREMLQRGFTTARDCGGADASLKEAISEWLIPGPRLLIAGHALSQTGGHGDQRPFFSDEDPTLKCCAGHRSGIGRLCDGPTECSVAVRDEIRKGADFIKIMGGGGVASRLNNLGHQQFLDEEIQAITKTAASFDTYVTAHAYTVRAMQHMIKNGVLGIEHGNFLDEETAQLMVEKGIYMTPTLATHYGMTVPPYDQFLNEVCTKKNEAVMASGLQALKVAAKAGVTVCFGSDLVAGMHQFQLKEFSLRSQVQTPEEIMRSVTLNNAKVMRLENDVGQIKEGFFADLVVLEKNPLEDITIMDDKANMLAVVKEGHVAFSSLDNWPVTTDRAPW